MVSVWNPIQQEVQSLRLSFAAEHKDKCLPLMDNGHYHPTEVVSDKIPSLLCFFPEIALHVTRPVRWDSDHVVLFDDETREIAKEIVRNDALDRVYIALITLMQASTVFPHGPQDFAICPSLFAVCPSSA